MAASVSMYINYEKNNWLSWSGLSEIWEVLDLNGFDLTPHE